MDKMHTIQFILLFLKIWTYRVRNEKGDGALSVYNTTGQKKKENDNCRRQKRKRKVVAWKCERFEMLIEFGESEIYSHNVLQVCMYCLMPLDDNNLLPYYALPGSHCSTHSLQLDGKSEHLALLCSLFVFFVFVIYLMFWIEPFILSPLFLFRYPCAWFIWIHVFVSVSVCIKHVVSISIIRYRIFGDHMIW